MRTHAVTLGFLLAACQNQAAEAPAAQTPPAESKAASVEVTITYCIP